jgi:hypothetical protein
VLPKVSVYDLTGACSYVALFAYSVPLFYYDDYVAAGGVTGCSA